MNEKTKKRLLITGGIIAALILLWLLLKKNPAIAQAVQKAADAIGLPTFDLLSPDKFSIPVYDSELGEYVPADMPAVEGENTGFAGCSFCSTSRSQVVPPSPVAAIVPQKSANIIPFVMPPPSVMTFGSAGGGRNSRCYYPDGGTYPCPSW